MPYRSNTLAGHVLINKIKFTISLIKRKLLISIVWGHSHGEKEIRFCRKSNYNNYFRRRFYDANDTNGDCKGLFFK